MKLRTVVNPSLSRLTAGIGITVKGQRMHDMGTYISLPVSTQRALHSGTMSFWLFLSMQSR